MEAFNKENEKTATDYPYWSVPASDVIQKLKSNINGLSSTEAKLRLRQYGANSIKAPTNLSILGLFLSQFKSPVIIILLCASALSVFLHDITNSAIIFLIILISGILSFWQEKGARGAVEKLLAVVQIRAKVIRDASSIDIPVEQIVPGDIISLQAGDILPGDCLLLSCTDLFVDEASLTGESFPVEKSIATLNADTVLAQRHNSVFMGTHVISGTAKAVVIHTGKKTELGNIAKQLSLEPPLTEFEAGIKKFGYMLMEITLLLVLIIFAINIYFARPVIESLLFSLALAVGLTPQLLPAIISINLAHGAKKMAESKVIVKKLSSIENFGSMNVLCSDKTGTLTEGEVKVKDFVNIQGDVSDKVLLYGYLNSFFESGFQNPMDKAIINHIQPDISAYEKQGEIPYDFIRKRLSILVKHQNSNLLITKGAVHNILEVCTQAEKADGTLTALEPLKKDIHEKFETLSKEGYRIIGLAYKNTDAPISKQSESELIFLGFIILFDPPKEGIIETIKELNKLGVNLKIITGDNQYVSAHLAASIFPHQPQIMSGRELHAMGNDALLQKINTIDVFAEVEPNQKERILTILKKKGNVVGYIGDGINDASALHVADVGISVDTAVDVAKESADIVLLKKNLNVLISGVKEGRKTFSNTMKYIFMATSANFGNMFSMAGISVFLPFLPLLPVQILLMNLLTDLPEMTIATDNVEKDQLINPKRWDINLVKRFMIVFGLLSSVFDFITFGVLITILHANQIDFRSGWFTESVISASVIVLLVRTRKSIFKSTPGKYLIIAVTAIVLLVAILPYTVLGKLVGITNIPSHYWIGILSVVTAYIICTELVKKAFYKYMV